MKRLLALMGFFPLVWVKTYDQRPRLRMAHVASPGYWYVYTHSLFVNAERLGASGAPHQSERVPLLEQWVEWEHNKKHVVFTSTLQ